MTSRELIQMQVLLITVKLVSWILCLAQGTSLEAYLQLVSKVTRTFPVAQSKGSLKLLCQRQRVREPSP